MSRISLELVPRAQHQLHHDLQRVTRRFPQVDTFNVPQQRRFAVTALDGAAMAQGYARSAIPHLRSCDHSAGSLPALAERLQRDRFDEVIVIAGDDSNAQEPLLTPAAMIAELCRLLPALRVYAALDPYRHTPARELDGLQHKLAAGAHGVFTQPLFDPHLQAAWAALLPADIEVFWGVAPVLSAASARHWQKLASITLPRDFAPTLAWNAERARLLMTQAERLGQHVYLMPVRCDPVEYLDAVLMAA